VLNALAENAGLIVRGDDNGLMNKLAIALQTETPKPAAPASAPTSQSHIRAARRSAPQTEVPHTGPMAAILAKVFGKKPGA
jgi:PTH1 family peptidyl-tRNA hydrolase